MLNIAQIVAAMYEGRIHYSEKLDTNVTIITTADAPPSTDKS
jgi:hypothetical protein